MTDLRTLLHEAAPSPRQPLDMRAVRARARSRRRIRLGVWLTSIGAVLGLGIPVGVSLVPVDRDGAETVQTVGSTTTTTSSEELVPGPGPTALPTPGPMSPARSPGRAGPAAVPGAGAPVASSSATTAQPSSEAATGENSVESARAYPLAAACVVDNVGLAGGAERRCRFTATVRGGASMRTTGAVNPPPGTKAEVIVTREGQTTTHNVSRGSTRAGAVGVVYCTELIEPGDLVEAVFTNMPVPDGEEVRFGAGKGWACWE